MRITDFSNNNISPKEIADHLNEIWLGVRVDIPRKEYYCGVACEVEKRFCDHKRDDWDILQVVAIANCGTQKRAAEVEGLMGNKGFDIGDTSTPGNGGCKRSVYVYLVRKGGVMSASRYKTLHDFLNEALEEK